MLTQGVPFPQDIQSTNWQSVRLKPPPPNSDMGWRVEFRTMEVQMTDFENAAFSIFMILLTRAVLAFNLNFYVPISKVSPTDPIVTNYQLIGTHRSTRICSALSFVMPAALSRSSSERASSRPTKPAPPQLYIPTAQIVRTSTGKRQSCRIAFLHCLALSMVFIAGQLRTSMRRCQ